MPKYLSAMLNRYLPTRSSRPPRRHLILLIHKIPTFPSILTTKSEIWQAKSGQLVISPGPLSTRSEKQTQYEKNPGDNLLSWHAKIRRQQKPKFIKEALRVTRVHIEGPNFLWSGENLKHHKKVFIQ